jgi:hypothetical protein
MKHIFYNRLKRVIPGIAKETTLEELNLKFEEARSNPDLVFLTSRFRYMDIVKMAKELVNEGVFNHGQLSGLSYVNAWKAVQAAAESPPGADDLEQAPRCHKDGAHKLGTLGSPLPEARLPTSTSGTAISSFDLLLEEHLKYQKLHLRHLQHCLSSTQPRPSNLPAQCE